MLAKVNYKLSARVDESINRNKLHHMVHDHDGEVYKKDSTHKMAGAL